MAFSEKFKLDGQIALVTGASSGIGQGSAIELARAGADVVVNYRSSKEGAEETVAQIKALGRRAVMIQADVSKEDEIRSLFDETEEALGPADIVFSNAGLQRDSNLTDMTLDDWNMVLSVNLTGAFLVGREAVERFRRKGMRKDVSASLGKLIFDSSVHQQIPWAFHVNYAASKGGIFMLMQSIAQEVASEKIRVNAVAPGAIATRINAAERESGQDEMLQLIPYGRIGEPSDIGRVVAFLASDASEYIVGQTLFVDGGMTLYPGFKGNG